MIAFLHQKLSSSFLPCKLCHFFFLSTKGHHLRHQFCPSLPGGDVARLSGSEELLLHPQHLRGVEASEVLRLANLPLKNGNGFEQKNSRRLVKSVIASGTNEELHLPRQNDKVAGIPKTPLWHIIILRFRRRSEGAYKYNFQSPLMEVLSLKEGTRSDTRAQHTQNTGKRSTARRVFDVGIRPCYTTPCSVSDQCSSSSPEKRRRVVSHLHPG